MSEEFEQSKYELNIDQFLHRFRNSKKLDDLFSRGYTICIDSYTNERTILKFYSIQTTDQEQAVLENLLNFTKLNKIQGICKLVAYAVAESGTQLISAFQYHPITFGEYVKIIKNENIKEYDRLQIYLDFLEEITRVVSMGVEIGIQMDDINRQTIIVRQNPLANQTARSSSSISVESRHVVDIFYDEREKEYHKMGEKNGQGSNKIYWTAEKIESQAFRGVEFSSQQGEESIYQIGLMMLDVIYEIESHYQAKKANVGELKPDQVAVHAENPLSYYLIDRDSKQVRRNQMLVSHRLNYLLTNEEELVKQVGVLLKGMIVPMAEARPGFNKIITNLKNLQDGLNKYHTKVETPMKSLQNNGESLKSLESLGEQYIHLSIAQTVRNDDNTKSAQVDSLKYSESYGEGKQRDNMFKRNNNSPSPVAYRKEGNNPLSATTITSDATNKLMNGMSGYESNKNTFQYESPREVQLNSQPPNQLTYTTLILDSCKIHGEGLRKLLTEILNQIQSYQRTLPNFVMKKEYLDQSIYYGCVDESTKREGLGVYMYKTGDIYFGRWKENILTKGTYLFKNGESFQGTVKNGKQGLGIYRYSNGNIYDGFWKDDLKNGEGKMHYPSGAKYEGEWLKGKKHGQGIYYYQNGIQYRGGFALGKKYGNGVFLFPNGTKVEGFWDNNHLEGLAKIYYQNGDYYEGNLHMSQKTGEGIYKWNNVEEGGEVQYKGEFTKDNLDGFATIRFKNGEIYEGKVKNGKRDGQGTYKYMNGDQFKGEWKNDQKQIGKYTFSTGDEFEGKFKQGQMGFGTLKYQNGEIYQGEFYKGERSGVGTYSNKLGQLVYEGHWERDEYVGPNKH